MSCTLNENIKRLRLARGSSQVSLARELGVTKQCVSNWENGNVLPSIEMLSRLADIFAVTADYLLGRNESALLDVSSLTDAQRGHISLLIEDFTWLNGKG